MDATNARDLFAEPDALTERLRQVNQALDQSRRSWSDGQGYRVPVRIEQFRREVAG